MGGRTLGFWIGIVMKSMLPVLLLAAAGYVLWALSSGGQGEAPSDFIAIALFPVALAVVSGVPVVLSFSAGRHLRAAQAGEEPVVFARQPALAIGSLLFSLAVVLLGFSGAPNAPVVCGALAAVLLFATWKFWRWSRQPITLSRAGLLVPRISPRPIAWSRIRNPRTEYTRGVPSPLIFDLVPESGGGTPQKIGIGTIDLAADTDELLAAVQVLQTRYAGPGRSAPR